MISVPTVIVIGAGGSVPYGFPTGEDLISNIVLNLTNPEFTNRLVLDCGFKTEQTTKLKNNLSGSNLKSIDAFLEHQSDDIKKLGKVAIAQEIMKYTDYTYIDKKDDWYKEVWNSMYSQPDLLYNNEITFVTFNYDLSLEHYLYNSIMSSYDLTAERARGILSSFKIIHLHGKIGEVPWSINYQKALTLDLVNVSEGIKIISDDSLNVRLNGDFSQAHQKITEAKRLYFIGFGYHEINLERLNINGLNAKERVAGSSKGLTNLRCEQIETLLLNGTKRPYNGEILTVSHQWSNLEFFKEKVLLD